VKSELESRFLFFFPAKECLRGCLTATLFNHQLSELCTFGSCTLSWPHFQALAPDRRCLSFALYFSNQDLVETIGSRENGNGKMTWHTDTQKS
jgi:hypothetical protein